MKKQNQLMHVETPAVNNPAELFNEIMRSSSHNTTEIIIRKNPSTNELLAHVSYQSGSTVNFRYSPWGVRELIIRQTPEYCSTADRNESIRTELKSGKTQEVVGQMFGLSQQSISRISRK